MIQKYTICGSSKVRHIWYAHPKAGPVCGGDGTLILISLEWKFSTRLKAVELAICVQQCAGFCTCLRVVASLSVSEQIGVRGSPIVAAALLPALKGESSMTPPSNHHPCEGCALQEARGGRVCPAAREVHRLPDVEAPHRSDVLHVAIVREARPMPTLPELVRRDALSLAGALPVATRLGLLPAPTPVPLSHDPRKEAIRVLIATRTSR